MRAGPPPWAGVTVGPIRPPNEPLGVSLECACGYYQSLSLEDDRVERVTPVSEARETNAPGGVTSVSEACETITPRGAVVSFRLKAVRLPR